MTSFYDRVVDLLAEPWDDNLHAGSWYDEHDTATFERAAGQLTDQVVARLGPVPGRRLLDVGRGVGAPALHVAATRGVRVVGFSVSGRQVHRARCNAEAAGLADRVRFVHADATAPPFADGSFDGAWAIESMFDLPDRDRTVQELARVLRPERGWSSRTCTGDGRSSLGFGDYRGLVEGAGMTLVDLVDITPHTVVPPAATAALIATLHRRRDRYARMVGTPMYQRLTDPTADPFGYPGVGYALVTARR